MNRSISTYCQTLLDATFSGTFVGPSSTGKEKDSESGYHYFGARYYDSEALTGWLSVDPMSDKYPSMSPYNYCAWNPVKLVDPDGLKFKIPGKNSPDHNPTMGDIVSLVNPSSQHRVMVDDDGFISIDISDLDSKQAERLFKKDKGLALLNDLILSKKKFYYENSDFQTLDDYNSLSIESDNNGIVNASDGGLDSKNGYTCSLREGFNGQVVLARSGKWYNEIKKTGWPDQRISMRKSILYHELRENYYRTELGINYNDQPENANRGAHARAARDEGFSFGNIHPGEYNVYEFKQ